MKALVIYHKNCNDGSMAAAVAKHWLDIRKSINAADIDFHEGVYGEDPPEINSDYSYVFILDFSYPKEITENIIQKCKESSTLFLCIDHHKTAAKELESFSEKDGVHFDMNTSGCELAWRLLFPEAPINYAVQLIADRDLWKFDLENSKIFHAGLSVINNSDIQSYADLINNSMLVQEITKTGIKINSMHHNDISDIIDSYTGKTISIEGNVIPVVNCTDRKIISELCHELLKRLDVPCVGCYYDAGGYRNFSLRSIKDFDCSALSESFEGGGHKNASGFRVPLNEILKEKSI